MKRNIIFFAFLVSSIGSFAQTNTPPSATSFWSDPVNNPMFPLYLMTTLVFVAFLLIVVVLFYMLSVLNSFIKYTKTVEATEKGVAVDKEVTWWEKLWQAVNAHVPLEEEKNLDLNHNYDGIRELDNHLPPWWKWLFYVTIIWSAIYLVIYNITFSLPSSLEEYDNELVQADVNKKVYLASQPASVIDEANLVFEPDPQIIADGKKVFTANNCASCHGIDGGGNAIGPNLTDQYWIKGGGIKNIFAALKNGSLEKGMPAWGNVMPPKDLRDVAFYVMSLQGTSPLSPKAPQGDLYTPEPKLSNDSTKLSKASI